MGNRSKFKNFFRFFLFGLLLFAILIFIFGIRKNHLFEYTETKILMDTIVTIEICSSQSSVQIRKIFNDVWSLLESEIAKFNIYDPNSEVSKINRAAGKLAVQVSPEVYYVIKESLMASQSTDGAFDITVKPLIAFWRQKAVQGQFPSQEEIAEVLKLIGSDKVILLADNQVKLAQEGMALDLGGIAKGYLVDYVSGQLRVKGINNFLVVAGGDIFASGVNSFGRPWKIAVRNPYGEDILDEFVFLSNAGVTTSGDYERFVQIDGKKYSHIVDPRTGLPAERMASATVIAPTTMQADVLSTSLNVLDDKRGIEIIENQGSAFAVMILKKMIDGRLEKIKSESFKSFQSNN